MSAGGHLILVGLMGAGKTTVGQECARQLDRPFVDTDDLVLARTAIPIAEFFATHGEAAFRAVEREVVEDVCQSPERLVIACGGGTVTDPDSRRRLRAAGTVVWLRAPVGVLLARVGPDAGATRPLLAGDPAVALTRLEAAREAAYDAVAHVMVDTEDRSVDTVADEVLRAYEGARS